MNTVDVIIAVGPNDAHFLSECLPTVLQQDHIENIFVVADGCDIPLSEHYALIQSPHRNSHKSRRLGVRAGTAPFILFLDVDNKLNEGHVVSCLSIFNQDRNIGLVYQDIQYFGNEDTLTPMKRNVDYNDLILQNSCDTGSMLRRETVEQLALMEEEPDGFEDWWLARKVLASGWRAVHQPIPLLYRRHAAQRCVTESLQPWYKQTSILSEKVTIFGTISQRQLNNMDLWWRKVAWILGQDWPRNQINLVFANTSNIPTPNNMLTPLYDAGFNSIHTYNHETGYPNLETQPRNIDVQRQVQTIVSGIYNRAFGNCHTDFVLTLEDDIIPLQPDLIYRLITNFDPRTVGIAASYRLRHHPYPYSVWKVQPTAGAHTPQLLLEPGHGYTRMEGIGFGCTLWRLNKVKHLKLFGNSDLISPEGNIFFDVDFCRRIRLKQLILAVDWALQCEHVNA